MDRALIILFAVALFLIPIAADVSSLGNIEVAIKDKMNNPVVNARVSLIPVETQLTTRVKFSDANGVVRFNNVFPGIYCLRVHSEMERYQQDNLKVIKGDTLKITIKMKEDHSSGSDKEALYGQGEAPNDEEDAEVRFIDSWDKFNKTPEIKTMYENSGFVIFPSSEKDLYESYIFSTDRGDNIFVTTDLIYHTAHLFFDYSLRIIELESLLPSIESLNDRMIQLTDNQYKQSSQKTIKEMIRLNKGFFSVAKLIFDPGFNSGPEWKEIKKLAEAEYSNIVEYSDVKYRNLLSYAAPGAAYAKEDYTQYIPRGHYTRNESFKKYFRVMMWLGRMNFKLRPGSAPADKEAGRMMTLQALLMTDALMNDEEALKSWRTLDKTIGFFMGQSDDLGPEDYYPLLSEVFGAKGSPDRFADRKKLESFIEKAMKLRDPKILSGIHLISDGIFQETTKGFSFLGQRSVPDSYIMQELVYSKKESGTILHYTGNGNPFTLFNDPAAGPVRGYPRALDIMAALGSNRACELLKQEGDTEYTEYDNQLEMLRKYFSAWTETQWLSSLYNRSLHSFIPILKTPEGKNLPEVFASSQWLDKELLTALSYWSELRHDTILYAKQAYGETIGVVGNRYSKLEYPSGYVEPYPDVYDRIQKMLLKMTEILDELENCNKELIEKNQEFQELLTRLVEFSKAECEGKTLSKENYNYLQTIGSLLKDLKGFSPELMSRIVSGSDDRMDVIADVFTNPWEKQVLEEGVGSPMYIFVYIDDAQGRRICRGMTYSYYEFKQPMNDRLSDEKWQRMGKQNNRSALPAWTKSFIFGK